MCVILIAEEKPLTGRMIRRAYTKNPDGLGMAWNDGKLSHYVKDITLSQALKLRKTLPLPYVFHARYATEGGVDPTLCHPFPVTTRRADRTEGRCPRVLFHNGHWGDWKATLERIEKRWGVQRPDGPMSDSRAMAFIVATVGEGVLDMQHGQKFALVDTHGIHRYGKGWKKWQGFWVSNTRWVPVVKPKGSSLFVSLGSHQKQLDKVPAPPLRVVDRRRGKLQPEPPEQLGFYTVPSESGAAILVKARSTTEAFQVAAGHAPGWRKRFAKSDDSALEVQKLEDWMKDGGNSDTWNQPLIDIDED